MSELAIVRTASRTMASPRWWHLSIHAGGFDVADGIIEELVTPLVAHARTLGLGRWYFVRDALPDGPGVLVNIQGPPAEIEMLQRRYRQMCDGAKTPKKQYRSQHAYSVPLEPRAAGRSGGGAKEADQQAEADLKRYGGVKGLYLAEEVFEVSSELALWACRRFQRAPARSAFAALVLFDSAQSMGQGSRAARWPSRSVPWDHYWDQHLAACTADVGHRANAVREAMSTHVVAKSALFHALMSATAAEATVQNWRRRWFRTIDTYLYRAHKAKVAREAQELTLHQAHLTMRRLGVRPHEEAAFGLHARSWADAQSLATVSLR